MLNRLSNTTPRLRTLVDKAIRRPATSTQTSSCLLTRVSMVGREWLVTFRHLILSHFWPSMQLLRLCTSLHLAPSHCSFISVLPLHIRLAPSSSSCYFIFALLLRLAPSSCSFIFVMLFHLRLDPSSSPCFFISFLPLHIRIAPSSSS